jgi:hypothetical protein
MSGSAKRWRIEPLGRPRPYTGPLAVRARVDRRRLIVDLKDRRTLIVPLDLIPWFDRLPSRAFATPELIGGGYAIYFPAIDEAVGVENLFLPPDQILVPKILPRLIDRRPRPVHARPG